MKDFNLFQNEKIKTKTFKDQNDKNNLKCDTPDEELLLHQRIHQAYTLLGSFRPGYNKKVNHKKLEANFYNSSDYKNLKLLSSSNSTGTSVCSTCDGCSDRNSEISDYDIDDLFPYHNFSSSRRSSKMNDTTSLKGRHRNASLSKGILDFFRFKIFKPGGSGPSKKFTSRSLDFLVLLISRILIFLLLLLFSIFLTHSHYRSRYYKYGPYEPQKIIKSDPSHNCSITLGQNLEIVPLVSFPGSGNTWLRHLLEEVSGTFTGSVYNDWRIYKKGFTGEYEHPLAKNTLVVKTHLGNPGNRDEKWLPMEEMFDYGTKSGGLHCIYLLRHPVDTYFSTTNFQKTHTHKGKISPPDFHSSVGRQLWRYLVLDWSNYYYQTYTELSQNCRHGIKLVFYEDLVKNPWRLSKNLVTWIETVNEKVQQKENGTYLKENRDPILLRKKRSNFEILRQQRKTCFEMYSEGNFHRKHMPNERKFNLPSDLFTDLEKNNMDILMTKLNSSMDGRIPDFYSFYSKN